MTKNLTTKNGVRANDSPIRLAVIDLGTNSVRADIYEISEGRILRVYRRKRMIRLGDGVFTSGSLQTDGEQRTIQAFLKFKAKFENLNVQKVAAYGTSALRSAKNANDLVSEIKSQTGIHVNIISGEEEGHLIAQGILNNIELPKGVFALVDIGGGSTEISLCEGDQVHFSKSYPLGANRLGQMFFKSYPAQPKIGEKHPIEAFRRHVQENLEELKREINKYEIKSVVGSSGTIRALRKILKRRGYPTRPFHCSDLSALIREMEVMSKEKLSQLNGLEPKRVDLILPGAILLEEILYAIKCPVVRVTKYALRDGLLLQELENLRL